MTPAPATQSIAERCYRLIREAIIVGEMAPGATFNESTLAQQFDVSTSPLREALTRLRQDGLVRVLPRKGYIVTELSLTDFHDLVQLRIVLETAAVELAAVRATQTDVDRLRKLAAVTIVPGDASNLREFMSAHQEFHLHLAEMSGNRRLYGVLEKSFLDIQRLLFANIGDGYGATNRDDHALIIDAIARRDPAAARTAVKAHIQESRDRILTRMIQDTGRVAVEPLGL